METPMDTDTVEATGDGPRDGEDLGSWMMRLAAEAQAREAAMTPEERAARDAAERQRMAEAEAAEQEVERAARRQRWRERLDQAFGVACLVGLAVWLLPAWLGAHTAPGQATGWGPGMVILWRWVTNGASGMLYAVPIMAAFSGCVWAVEYLGKHAMNEGFRRLCLALSITWVGLVGLVGWIVGADAESWTSFLVNVVPPALLYAAVCTGFWVYRGFRPDLDGSKPSP
jgi:hypothetical protein